MQTTSKTIQIFLPDGNPRGIKIAELTSRSVQAISVPRNLLEHAGKRDELHRVGLYFLVGHENGSAKPDVYIGESENCYTALQEHHKQTDFWQTAVVVVTNHPQNQFTQRDVKYLEHLAYREAGKQNRFFVAQTVPTQAVVPEWRQADLVDLFDTTKVLLSTLGYPIFDDYQHSVNKRDIEADEHLYYCKGRGVEAVGKPVDDGFLVLKGSQLAKEPTTSFPIRFPHCVKRIQQMIQKRILIEKDGQYVFQSDYLFHAPSTASDCILQRSTNGWVSWKDEGGRTLDENVRRKAI